MQKGYRLPQKKMLMGSSPSTVCHFYKLSPPHPTWALEVYEAAKLWVRGSSASCVLGTLLRAHSQEFRIFSQLSETLLYLPTFPGFSLTKGPDLGLRLHQPPPLPSPHPISRRHRHVWLWGLLAFEVGGQGSPEGVPWGSLLSTSMALTGLCVPLGKILELSLGWEVKRMW